MYDAIVSSKAELDMGVWTVGAGNRGLNVLVGFAHADHAEMEADQTVEWAKVVSAYDEANGEGQFQADNKKLKRACQCGVIVLKFGHFYQSLAHHVLFRLNKKNTPF